MSQVSQRPPLVGRDKELDFLLHRFEGALEGKSCLVLISGEAGVGKSRLTEEFAEVAMQRGGRVLVGRCVPGGSVAYLPFQEVLEAYHNPKRGEKARRSQKVVSAIKKSSPEILGATPMVGGVLKLTTALYKEYRGSNPEKSIDPERTFQAILEFLRSASSKQPLLIILDDLQWADSASLQLLHFLARNTGSLQVQLVGTYRTEELRRETQVGHSLLESIRIMRREEICQEIALERLNPEKTRLVIQGMLAGEISEDLLNKIAEESGGNPLFTIEIVRLLLDKKAISPRGDKWEESTDLDRIEIPTTVREVIHRRLDGLTEQNRRLLSYAAIQGEVFDPAILGETLGEDKLTVLEELAAIEQRYQLVIPTEEAFRFSHEKVRQVLYDETPLPLQRELHRKVGLVLEQLPPDDKLHGELSLHFCSASDKIRCIKYSIIAGQTALSKYAMREAIAYFDRVIETAGDDLSYTKERLEALEGLGDAKVSIGSVESGVMDYERFLKLCTEPLDIVKVLRKSAFATGGRRSLDFLSKAENYGEIDPLETARLKLIRAWVFLASGTFDEVERLYKEAATVFQATGAIEDLVLCLVGLSAVQFTLEKIASALETTKALFAISERTDNPRPQRWALEQRGISNLYLGLTDAALKDFSKCLEIATKFGYLGAAVNAHYFLGLTYSMTESCELMNQESRAAYELSLKTEDEGHNMLGTSCGADAEIHSGRIPQAEKLLDELSHKIASLGFHTDSFSEGANTYSSPEERGYIATFHMLKAELSVVKGNLAESKREHEMALNFNHHTMYEAPNEAAWRHHYAQALKDYGFKSEAVKELEIVEKTCDRLGNKNQARRARATIAQLAST